MSNLSFNLKASYGLGQLSVGALSLMQRICLFFFYSQILGLSPLLAGLASAIASLFDAITDPIIGSFSDNWRSKYGRRFPFLVIGTFPTALSAFLLFTPLVEGEILLFSWFVFFSCLTNLFLTFFAIPHFALGAELSKDYLERASVVGFRQFFYFFGHVIVLFLAYGYFFAPTDDYANGQLNPEVYNPFIIVVVTIYLLASITSVWKTKSVIPSLITAEKKSDFSFAENFKSIFSDIYTALQNRSFRMVFFGNIFTSMAAGVTFNLELYALTFFWGLSGEMSLLLVGLAFYPGAFIGVFIAKQLISILDKRNSMLYGNAMWIIFIIIPILMKLLGMLDDLEMSIIVMILVSFRIMQGIAITPCDIAFGSSLADISDEQEIQTHKRQEGAFFAAAFFSIKAALGLGSALSGFALWFIAWPSNVDNITSENLFDLGIVLGPFVAALGLISCYFFSKYDLSKKRHIEILNQLDISKK